MENYANSIYETISKILGYFQLVIGITGVIGNILVIVVFSRKSLRKYPYSFFCLVMAISDIGYMIHCFTDWYSYSLNVNLGTVGSALCPLTAFIPYYFGSLSMFLLTTIAIDRTLTIVYPRKLLIFKKRWFQIIIVVILASIVMLMNILVPLNYRLTEFTFGQMSIRICQMPSNLLAIQIWITLSIFLFFNVVINNFLNIKTILFIRSSRKRVAANDRNSSLSTKDRKFAVCSICLNLAAMLFKLPFFICLIIISYSSYFSIGQINMMLQITNTLTYIDNGFSFCINMLVNSMFFNEFLILFRLRKSSLLPSDSTANTR